MKFSNKLPTYIPIFYQHSADRFPEWICQCITAAIYDVIMFHFQYCSKIYHQPHVSSFFITFYSLWNVVYVVNCFLLFFLALETEPKAIHMLSKSSTNNLYPSPLQLRNKLDCFLLVRLYLGLGKRCPKKS